MAIDVTRQIPEEIIPTTLPEGQVSSLEVLGNAVSYIAPAVTAGVTISLVAAVAGTATLMVYAVVGILMLILAIQIATLSYYLPSAGGIYSYVSKALHPFFGFLIAITEFLIIPFSVGTVPLLAGSFLIAGLSVYFDISNTITLGAIVALLIMFLAWFLTCRGVKLSTNYGFILELISISAFIFMGFIVIIYNPHVDYQQLSFNFSAGDIGPALIFAVFSYGGFETAGNLALESRNKKKVASVMMILSIVISMFFFMFISYVIILGFGNDTDLLGRTAAPFNYIGTKLGDSWMGPVTDIAMALALVSGCVAIFNTVSRRFYSMGIHGILPGDFARLHLKYKTPTFATNIVFIMILPITLLVLIKHIPMLSIMNSLEGVSSLVMGCSYFLSSISVPVLLWKENFRGLAFWLNIIMTCLVVIPVLGFVFYKTLVPLRSGLPGDIMIFFITVYGVIMMVYIMGKKGMYVEKIARSFSSDKS